MFFLVFARTTTPFIEMGEAIGGSFCIESCFEVGKGEVDLDDYEVRRLSGLISSYDALSLRSSLPHTKVKETRPVTTGKKKIAPASEQTQDQQGQSRASLDLPVMVPLTLLEVR